MRALVEQTLDAVQGWLENLEDASELLQWSDDVKARIALLRQSGPHLLMGGQESSRLAGWHLAPEQHAILIGTQDMLLSRALNRGYAESRFRWPVSFGLLNSDCLWVFDETQLMGVGVETSTQLQALREKLGTMHKTVTWWMSATLDRSRFQTVDAVPADYSPTLLGEEDTERLQAQLRASKPLQKAPLAPTSGRAKEVSKYISELADLVLSTHQEGSLTLVVLNRVTRAQNLALEITERRKGQAPVLIHSRFRPAEREAQLQFLRADRPEGILIATQAVEAGVDIDARLLITELSPWSSIVQRAGRCNRRGLKPDASILWIDLDPTDDELVLPYATEELAWARAQLEKADDLSLENLQPIAVPEQPVIRPVLRRKDLIELFDTTPDLLGADLDISRFVRDGEDTDVQVFWRELPQDPQDRRTALARQPAPRRDELCRVSVFDFGKWLQKRTERPRVFRWDYLEARWALAERALPGETYLLDRSAGGYDNFLGWTREAKHVPDVLTVHTEEPEAHGDDPSAQVGVWLNLRDHTRHVEEEIEAIIDRIGLVDRLAKALQTAAHWHDIGKAHEVFQKKLRAQGVNSPRQAEIWAKSERGPAARAEDITAQERRRFRAFRHELASALGWLTSSEGKKHPDRDLVAYLIAAHHGKVRLSLRSAPDEPPPDSDEADPLFARGVWHRDVLPGAGLPEIRLNGAALPPLTLDLRLMRAGGTGEEPSWLERTLRLRDEPALGPFRLAALEALLRAADMRASAREADAHPTGKEVAGA